jgi:hypothetical protein
MVDAAGISAVATGIIDSGGILEAAAQESPRGKGRSVVTEMASHAKFARPTLTGYDQSRSGSTRPRWARNVIEPGGETHRRSTVYRKLPVGGPCHRVQRLRLWRVR